MTEINQTDNLTRKLLIPAAIFIVCFLLYCNAINSEYVFDDYIYTFNNEYIKQGFSAIKDIFNKDTDYGFNKTHAFLYRPLTLLSFMAEVSLFGFKPHVSHFINILIFALTVVLLYFFLRRILKNYSPWVSIAATLLFAFDPIHTEVVDSIKNRDEILGLFFGVISFYFIMLNAENSGHWSVVSGQEENQVTTKDSTLKTICSYLISLTSFLIAIFCKENCLTFVLIIPILLYFFTPLKVKKIVFKTVPFIMGAGIYLFIRSMVLGSLVIANPIPVWSNSLMAATNNADSIATSFVLMEKYIYMTIIPYPLSWDYSYNQIPVVSWSNIKPILSLIICIMLIGYAIYGIRKKSIYSFLIAFFFITLFLSSNLVIKIAWTFGERFLYVPSLAFCIAVPVLLMDMAKSCELRAKSEKRMFPGSKILILTVPILVVYAFILIPRNEVWKNNFAFYESGIKTAPNSYRPYRCLGLLYVFTPFTSTDSIKKVQYYSFAAQELKKSISICMRTDAFYNLGVCYEKEGYNDSAISIYKNVIDSNNEFSPNAANNLGSIYLKEKNYPLAFHYDSIVLNKSSDKKSVLARISFIHNEIGIQYANNNELDKAFEEFHTAFLSDSNAVNPIGNMGIVYEKKGNIEMAKYYFQKALSRDPQNKVFAKDLESLNPAPNP